MRNISFALTTPQFYRRTKIVTRRLGWEDLEQGVNLCGVKKCQGIKAGGLERLAIINVQSVRRERLNEITPEEVTLEGFPGMKPRDFVKMFVESHESCTRRSKVTRIQYQYIPGGRFVVRGFCRVCGCSEYGACTPNAHGDTCCWVDDQGRLTNSPTTLCSRCALIERF